MTQLAQALFFIHVAVCLNVTSLWAATGSKSCAGDPSARQLDYWLGDWSVASPGSAGRGHSKVHIELDKCMVVESWGSDTSNHRGENTLAYNAEDQTWYGLFVDNQGRVHALSGTATPALAEFKGASRDETGKPILKGVKLVRTDANHVEQIWEKSSDNGALWVTEFTMNYERKGN